MIEIKNVTKTYGKKQNAFRALTDVSFSIPKGASVAVIGKSGSGKSTLMHAMSGLDRPEKGEVVVDGKNILRLRPKAVDRFRSATIGFVFQSFFIQANETCYQNVSLPLEIAKVSRSKRRGLVERALGQVELSDKIGQRGSTLSGGQKQRLAIARAIVNDPGIIFADEPTGNLDSVTGNLVERLLFSYNRKKGTTLVVVTHDEDLAAKCDMRVYLKDGWVEKIVNKKSAGTAAKKPAPKPKVVTL